MVFAKRLSPWLTPAIAPETKAPHLPWFWPFLVVLLTAIANIFLCITIDNTNVGTTNGLWKSTDVANWTKGSGHSYDSGGVLYAAAYGRLAALIPDEPLRYGSPAPDVTFRKMALLNGLFGGIASGAMFLLAFRFTGSRLLAAVICFTHAGAGFVLLNSVNSEDIIPAYALFLIALLCLFEFLWRGGPVLFFASALCIAMATLLHWTVMIPSLACVGAVFLTLLKPEKRFWGLGVGWLALFIVLVQVLVTLAFPRRAIMVWNVLYPVKATAGGWIGLMPQKFAYLAVGAGNYFTGGWNIADYMIIVRERDFLYAAIATWILLGTALVTCVAVLLGKTANRALRALAAAALGVFVAGELIAVYSQPQDPQMQIQPMTILILGLILLPSAWISRKRPGAQRVFAAALFVIAALNCYWNLRQFTADRGADSRALAGITEIERLFPKDKSALVWQGYETWVTWQNALLWPGNFPLYTERNVLLTVPFSEHGLTAAAAVAHVRKQIDGAFAEGRRVFASPVWTWTTGKIAMSLSSVADEATARAYAVELRNAYRTGTSWETPAGAFVELLPAQQPSAAVRPLPAAL